MKPIRKAIDDNILKIYEGKTQLLISELKDADAAVLGASLHVFFALCDIALGDHAGLHTLFIGLLDDLVDVYKRQSYIQ